MSRFIIMKKLFKQFRAKWHNDIYAMLEQGIKRDSDIHAMLEQGVKRDSDIYTTLEQNFTPPPPQLKSACFLDLYKLVSSLQDDLSRILFFARIEKDMTGKMGALYRAMITPEHLGWLYTKKDFLFNSLKYGVSLLVDLIAYNFPIQKQKIYLYGLLDNKSWLWALRQFVTGMEDLHIHIDGICIPSSDVKNFEGIETISENNLCGICGSDEDAAVVIFSTPWGKGTDVLIKTLLDSGITRNQISFLIEYIEIQYFENEIFHPGGNEVFVDAGFFDFSQSKQFISWSRENYQQIYAFEPSPACYERCVNVLNTDMDSSRHKIQLVKKGLGDGSKIIRFFDDVFQSGASSADINGNTEIEVVALDEFLNGKPVTFIKMDIEGSELSALQGAQNTIKRWKPRLAISIYHKWDDIIEIPGYILSLVPEYKMYIRHYSNMTTETVLLCTV